MCTELLSNMAKWAEMAPNEWQKHSPSMPSPPKAQILYLFFLSKPIPFPLSLDSLTTLDSFLFYH